MAGWPIWRSLGLGMAAAGCAASAGRDERVSGLNVKKSWAIPLGDRPANAERLAWAPDSRRLAVGGVADSRMSVWDVREVRRLPEPENQEGGVQALAYSPDGRYLAVSRGSVPRGKDMYSVSIRDAESGALIQGLVEEPSEIKSFEASSVMFSWDGRYLAVGYSLRTAVYAREGAVWGRTGGFGPGANRVALSPDGLSIAIWRGAMDDPRIVLCRMPSLDVFRDWPILVGGAYWGFPTLAYRPSGGQIAAGRGPGLGIYAPEDGSLLKHLTSRASYFSGLSYSPNGRYLAAGDLVGIRVFDAETWTELLAFAPDLRRRFHQNAFSPDGTMLAAAAGPDVKIWEFSR
jgi:WD40 repeat protein